MLEIPVAALKVIVKIVGGTSFQFKIVKDMSIVQAWTFEGMSIEFCPALPWGSPLMATFLRANNDSGSPIGEWAWKEVLEWKQWSKAMLTSDGKWLSDAEDVPCQPNWLGASSAPAPGL